MDPLLEYPLAKGYVDAQGGRLLRDMESSAWYRFAAGWDKALPGSVSVGIREYLLAANPDPSDDKLCQRYASEPLGSKVGKMVSEIVEVRGSDTFDLNPCLVGIAGGAVHDVRNRITRPAEVADFVSRATGCASAPAGTPRFDAFLARTFPGDPDTVAYLLRALGYCLTGFTDEHRALFFQGAPATGKSALIEIVKLVFGTYCKSVPARTFVRSNSDEHPTIVANLKGPRLVTFAETGDGGKLDDEMMNSVIAGDSIGARYMKRDWFEFVPTCKLVMASNFRPRTSGPESGVYRRLRVIHFASAIPEAERIQGLARSIVKAEGPAILALLLAEASAWHERMQRTGRSGLLPESDAVRAETERYFAESDPIGEFISINMEFGQDADRDTQGGLRTLQGMGRGGGPRAHDDAIQSHAKAHEPALPPGRQGAPAVLGAGLRRSAHQVPHRDRVGRGGPVLTTARNMEYNGHMPRRAHQTEPMHRINAKVPLSVWKQLLAQAAALDLTPSDLIRLRLRDPLRIELPGIDFEKGTSAS